ncbi:MAG: hypothetical protein HC838_04045 [Spirulinaceae cyanobacterium RM2_2_10]|nr:hypothetical protein [Spirulinaceae cyanobacterium SM2_1_0]NJO19401.1 hypothetical protein [Spirulinaceae cyanobacterium RM2_2_10]
MNQNPNKLLQIDLGSLGCWLTLLVVVVLLGSAGLLGWILNGIAILFLVLLFAPVVGVFVLRWWLRRNLIEDQCPVCDYSFTGLNNTECRCPNCGEPLQVTGGSFKRLTPPGTIDIEAIEVQTRPSDPDSLPS